MKLKYIIIILVIATFAYLTFNKYIKKTNLETIYDNRTDIMLEEGNKLGENFSIRIGRTITLEDGKMKIKFVDVLGDSRCPSGVQCIWAGQVTIVLNVEDSLGNLQNIDLTLGAGANASEDFKNIVGYTIKLLRIEPSPRIGGKIEKTDYIATLIVFRRIPAR